MLNYTQYRQLERLAAYRAKADHIRLHGPHDPERVLDLVPMRQNIRRRFRDFLRDAVERVRRVRQ